MLNLAQLANPVHSEEEAKALLKPYYGIIKKAMNDGLQQVVTCQQRYLFDLRADSTVINAAIVYMATRAITGMADIKSVKGGNTCFFYIRSNEESVGIKSRFKKLERSRRYRNLQTGRQLSLMQQQYNIPGTLPATYLTFGYILDTVRQKIDQYLITLQVGKKVYYHIDIDAELGSLSSDITTIPIIHPSTSTQRRRVRPRVTPSEVKPKVKGKSAGQE